MRSKFLLPKLFGVLAATLLLAGCAHAVDGNAVSAPVTVRPDGVDLEALDPGNYPNQPAPPYGAAGSENKGKLLEGARLADFVVLPTDVDTSLTLLIYNATSLLTDTDSLSDALAGLVLRNDEIAAAAQGFVAGFSSGRTGQGGTTQLVNCALVYPDDAAASAAATRMADISQTGTAQPIPGHDSTRASLETGDDWSQVTAFTAHGRYVLIDWALAPTTPPATGLVAGVLTAQKPLVDTFDPTDPAALAELPIDSTGVLAQTILNTSGDTATVENVVFGAAGAVHLETDPIGMGGLFEQVLVDSVVQGQASVYRSNWHTGGSMLADAFADEAVEVYGFTPAAEVPALPAARCFSVETSRVDGPETTYFCVGELGRYAFYGFSKQLGDLHQLMSAQYMVLAAE